MEEGLSDELTNHTRKMFDLGMMLLTNDTIGEATVIGSALVSKDSGIEVHEGVEIPPSDQHEDRLVPSLQIEGGEVTKAGGDAPLLEAGGRRSTPSTISDDAEEVGNGPGDVGEVGNVNREVDIGKRTGRTGILGKKRAAAKSLEFDGPEGFEDGIDGKRKPRKSARTT